MSAIMILRTSAIDHVHLSNLNTWPPEMIAIGTLGSDASPTNKTAAAVLVVNVL